MQCAAWRMLLRRRAGSLSQVVTSAVLCMESKRERRYLQGFPNNGAHDWTPYGKRLSIQFPSPDIVKNCTMSRERAKYLLIQGETK